MSDGPDLAIGNAHTAAGKASQHSTGFSARLFGYDIFLSFALGPPPRGTISYASDMARRLIGRDFSVFFSETEATPGDRLDTALRRALARSQMMIVVINRITLLEPRWVRKEVEEFRRCHPTRPVVTVNIDGALQDPALAEARTWLVADDTIWVEESAEAATNGIASEHVIDRLATAPARMRANVKWRRTVSAAIFMLVALGVGLAYTASVARDNADNARRQAEVAVSRQLIYQGAGLLPWNQAQGAEDAPFVYGNLFEGLALIAHGVSVRSTYEAHDALMKATEAVQASLPPIRYLPAAGTIAAIHFEATTLVIALKDGRIERWSPSSSSVQLQEVAEGAGSERIVFNKDRRLAALISTDNTLRVIDLHSGAVLPVEAVGGGVAAVTFTTDGESLLIVEHPDNPLEGDSGSTASQLGRLVLTVWNTTTHTASKHAMDWAGSWVFGADIAALPDNRTAVIAAGGLSAIDWKAGSIVRTFIGEEFCEYNTVDISPDGQLLAAGCAGVPGSSGIEYGSLGVWRTTDDARFGGVDFDDAGPPSNLRFSPDGATLVASYEGVVAAFNVSAFASGNEELLFVKNLWQMQQHDPLMLPDVVRFVVPGIDVQHLAIGPDGQIAVSDQDRIAVIDPWDVRDPSVDGGRADGQWLVDWPKGETLATAPDGSMALILEKDEARAAMAVWDVRNSRRLRQLGEQPGDPVDSRMLAAFSSDAGRLIVLTKDGTASLYDLRSTAANQEPLKIQAPGKELTAVALDRDGSIVFLGHDDGQVIAWNWEARTTDPVLSAAAGIDQLATDVSGRILAIAAPAGNLLPGVVLQFWDVLERRSISQLTPLGSISSIAFTPDGQRVAAVAFKQGIVVVDVASGRQVGQPLRLSDSTQDDVAFDADGRLIIIYEGLDMAIMFDPLSLLCDALNGDIGERRWAEVVGAGFVYQPTCMQERGLRGD